jgi:hypothetical protein
VLPLLAIGRRHPGSPGLIHDSGSNMGCNAMHVVIRQVDFAAGAADANIKAKLAQRISNRTSALNGPRRGRLVRVASAIVTMPPGTTSCAALCHQVPSFAPWPVGATIVHQP